MAVTAKWYGKAFQAAFNAEIDFNSDTIKAAICTSSYTPDQDAHDYFNDVTNEVTGTGYTAGGATLTGCTVTYDGASNTLKLDADDAVWSSSTITGRKVVIYKSTGTASTSPLLVCIESDTDIISSGAAWTLSFNAAGIATVTVA